MKPITYEIEPWVEIRLQRSMDYPTMPHFNHGDRWYIWNDLTQDEYIGPDGIWYQHSPVFFETPEAALAFWNSTKPVRNKSGE